MQNVVLVSREDNNTFVEENKTETFAANIFSLYQNPFFIKETGIGEYAKEYLISIVKRIHNHGYEDENNQDDVWSDEKIMKRINMVGDKYIRAKLMNEYFLYLKDNSSENNTEINELRMRLAQAEKEIYDLRNNHNKGETHND